MLANYSCIPWFLPSGPKNTNSLLVVTATVWYSWQATSLNFLLECSYVEENESTKCVYYYYYYSGSSYSYYECPEYLAKPHVNNSYPLVIIQVWYIPHDIWSTNASPDTERILVYSG